MPKEDSKIHQQSNYWDLTFHARERQNTNREGDHVIIKKGSKEIQIFTDTSTIRNIGRERFTSKEEAELIEIAKKYKR